MTVDRLAALEAALRWALPLAERALEDHRLQRLRAGHHDIGAGTSRIGLWPEEQDELLKARAALDAAPPLTTPMTDQAALERARLIDDVRDWHRIAKKKNEGMIVGFDTISALLSEIDATASEARAAADAEVAAWRECALYDPLMEGPAFKGWNRSALDRCRRHYIERALATPAQSPPICSDCGVNLSDPPSPLCPGCEAYREHQR